MSKVVQLRRGTTAQTAAYTGAQAELIVDTQKNWLIVHDGTTQGGHPLVSAEGNAASTNNLGGTLTGDFILSGTTNSTSTSTGILKLSGGLGVGKDIYASAIYDNGNRVFTSLTTTASGVLSVSQSANVMTVSPQLSGATAGTYGTVSSVPFLTVDQYGRVTSIGATAGGVQITIGNETGVNATKYMAFLTATSGTTPTFNVNNNFYYNPADNRVFSPVFQVSSDERIKTNIVNLENALQKVLSLRGVNFNYIANNELNIGVIAQEVEEIVPEVVTTNKMGFKEVNYDALIALCTAALQEQQKELKQLKELVGE